MLKKIHPKHPWGEDDMFYSKIQFFLIRNSTKKQKKKNFSTLTRLITQREHNWPTIKNYNIHKSLESFRLRIQTAIISFFFSQILCVVWFFLCFFFHQPNINLRSPIMHTYKIFRMCEDRGEKNGWRIKK